MADDSEAMTELAVAQYVLSSALEYRSEPLVAQEDAWARPERRGARWPIRPWRPPGGPTARARARTTTDTNTK